MIYRRISSALLLSISLNFPFTVQAHEGEENNVETTINSAPADEHKDVLANPPVGDAPAMNFNPVNFLSRTVLIYSGAALAIFSGILVSHHFLSSSKIAIAANSTENCTKKSGDIFHSKEETRFNGKKFVKHKIYVENVPGVNIYLNIKSGTFVPVDEKTFRLDVQDATKLESGLKKSAYFAANKDRVVSLSLLVPADLNLLPSTGN